MTKGTSRSESPTAKENEMAEPAKKRRGSKKKTRQSDSKTDGLLGSLKGAHEVNHEILDALGIKHPHIPLLSVMEMLDHLRDKHADQADA
jgi:hypothetical protein